MKIGIVVEPREAARPQQMREPVGARLELAYVMVSPVRAMTIAG